jgi:hypothetical protein
MERKKIRRKQEYGAVKIIYDANLGRRVRFVQNGTDGTFGSLRKYFVITTAPGVPLEMIVDPD